jgi:hypothetical protein
VAQEAAGAGRNWNFEPHIWHSLPSSHGLASAAEGIVRMHNVEAQGTAIMQSRGSRLYRPFSP